MCLLPNALISRNGTPEGHSPARTGSPCGTAGRRKIQRWRGATAGVRDALRISGSTIDRLVLAGRLPAPFRVGRSPRWRASAMVEFIDRQK